MVTVVIIAAITLLAVALVCFAALLAAGEHAENVAARRSHHRPAA